MLPPIARTVPGLELVEDTQVRVGETDELSRRLSPRRETLAPPRQAPSLYKASSEHKWDNAAFCPDELVPGNALEVALGPLLWARSGARAGVDAENVGEDVLKT